MKKFISIFVSIVLILCMFSASFSSFALSGGDFTYEIVDGKAVITQYQGSDTEVTIPATINGTSVVKINDYAFKGNETLEKVIINDGIEDIGTGAFENCTELAEISVPSTIKHVGAKAIYNTAYYNNEANWRLKTDGNGSEGVIDWEDISARVLQYLYLDTVLIEIELVGSYSIRNGTLVVADGAFKGNSGAIGIGFPKSLKTVGEYAFADCTSLENLKIPANVEFSADSIYNTGFYNNPENWENGVLYMDTRVVGIDSKEAVIKDGTTEIIKGALKDKNAVIPASVTKIHENTFIEKENVTIFGLADTFAQEYANLNNISFVDLNSITKGDVNFDGKTDSTDYEILCSVASLKEFEFYGIRTAGDMNEDGTVDGLDALILDLFLNDMGPSTIKGDADGNGIVNEDDYNLLVQIVSLNSEITDNYMFRRCDLNDDGAVDGFDALILDLALNRIVPII